VGLTVSLALTALPIAGVLALADWFGPGGVEVFSDAQPYWVFHTGLGIPLLGLGGLVLLTAVMHLARGIGRMQAMFAKTMLVARTGSDTAETLAPKAEFAVH
jgi:hypothetical protein